MPALVKVWQLVGKGDFPDLKEQTRRQREPEVAENERLAEPAEQVREHKLVVQRLVDVGKGAAARVVGRPDATVGRVVAIGQRLAERRVDKRKELSRVVDVLFGRCQNTTQFDGHSRT